MAIKLNAAYSKKLGLPNFSSHSFAASVEVELTDPGTIAAETARLYGILQTSVDNEIRQTGYLPNPEAPTRPVNGNGRSHATHNGNGNGNAGHNPTSSSRRHNTPVNGNGAWQCSDKQRRLLTDLTRELQLSEEDLDERAMRLFQRPARQLNKLSASGLITDLLDEADALRQSNGGQGNPATTNHRNGGAA
jgi:hypothetical protein